MSVVGLPVIRPRFNLQSDPHLTRFTLSHACASLLTLFSILPNNTSLAPKINNPVILLHGFADIPTWTKTWSALESVLNGEAGVPMSKLLVLQVPPLRHIRERVASAIDQITERFQDQSVHLIAHSMVFSPSF